LARQRPHGHVEPPAKLQISVDFGAGFGRNMSEEVANWQFFCRRCQKVVGKFGNFENSFYLSTVRGNALATVLSAASKGFTDAIIFCSSRRGRNVYLYWSSTAPVHGRSDPRRGASQM